MPAATFHPLVAMRTTRSGPSATKVAAIPAPPAAAPSLAAITLSGQCSTPLCSATGEPFRQFVHRSGFGQRRAGSYSFLTATRG